MAYTFHNSNPDGTINQAIASGQVGALFSSVTTGERLAGDVEFSKVWITSDEDVTTYVGINSYTAYGQSMFVSAAEGDQESDLTGTEDRYGALEVVSAVADYIGVEDDSYNTLMRVGDTIVVKEAPYEIDSIVYDSPGRSRVSAIIDFVTLPVAGEFITSMFTLNTTTAIPKPFWRERIVTAGSNWSGGNVIVDFIIGK